MFNEHIYQDLNYKTDSLKVIPTGRYIGFYATDRTVCRGSAHVELSHEDALDLAQRIIAMVNETAVPVVKDKLQRSGPPRYTNLSAQSQLIYRHMQRAGSISARDAMDDHGITSATLARRICDIEEEGFKITRDRRAHPITGRNYTRYSLTA